MWPQARTQMGLDISILFRVHTRVFSQFSTERRHVIRKTHLLATLSINRGIPPPVDGPFHQTCHCGEVRGKKNVQTCAEQGGLHDSIDPIRSIVENCGFDSIGRNNHLGCGPVSQPALKENRRGLIGEPLLPELLKGGVFVVLQVALNVPPILIELPKTCTTFEWSNAQYAQ